MAVAPGLISHSLAPASPGEGLIGIRITKQ